MSSIVFDDVWKVYKGGTQALRGLNLEVGQGEFFVFLGPSGCGKTTLLRAVAGLERLSAGRILLDGEDVSEKSPKERNVAMVFQSYSLYPHMTVYDNIAFGIQAQRLKKKEVDRRVREVAALLDVEPLLKKRPPVLSGGQKQRVAMGRAIVRRPEVFLMDEPLSNLDARARGHIRSEIARIQREIGVTTLYVTHDQHEAMVVGDRVGVLRDGSLQQVGSPSGLYRKPNNLFVAGFVGSPPMNLAEATVEEGAGDFYVRFAGHRLPVKSSPELRGYAWRQVVVGIRPESLVEPVSHPGVARDTCMRVLVERRESIGPDAFLYFTVDAPLLLAEDPRRVAEEESRDTTWVAERPNQWMARVGRSNADAGQLVELAPAPGGLLLFDPRTGDVIESRERGDA
jgi:multiple sugar transport system ATP-binding protein